MQDEDIVKRIEKKKYLESLKRKYGKDEKLIQLVEADLEYGLSISDVSSYVNRNLSFEEMQKISFGLRNPSTEDARNDTFDAEKTMNHISKLLYVILDHVEQHQYVLKRFEEEFACYQDEKEDLLRNLSDKDKMIQELKELVKESDNQLAEVKRNLEEEETRNKKIFLPWKRKAREELVCKIAGNKLSAEQISQIRVALRKGVDEKQITYMIEHDLTVEQMKEIMELSLLRNFTNNNRRQQK